MTETERTMETKRKRGGYFYTRVGGSFQSIFKARDEADDFEVLYDLVCIVEKVKTRWYIFARGTKCHEIEEVKKRNEKDGC